jgi:hypothetical protein
MSIKAYATTESPETAKGLRIDDKQILKTLGDNDKAVAVQLQELFASVTESITASLEVESQLVVEITGSISLKAQGSTKYLFFNVGAEAGATGTMKVTLTTTLKPKTEIKLSDKSKKTEK